MKRNRIVAVLALACAVPLGAAQAAPPQYIRADDDILDHDLEVATGEDVGEIEDLVVDRDGRVRFVLVERGGFLDLGDEHVAVPWDSVQFGDDLVIAMDETRLQDVPRFARDREVDWTDSEVVSEIAAFFGAEAEQIPGPPLRLEDELLDHDLILASGEVLGEVEEVVLDRDGRLRYLVVEHEGFLDIPQEVIVVPWEALQRTDTGMIVNLTREQFRGAPAFDDDDEIAWNDEAVMSEIASFYERQIERPVEEALTPER